MTKISSRQITRWPTLQRQVSACALGLMLALGVTQLSLAQAPAPVVVGQALPALNLKDQHDKPWQIKPSTRLVMFAAGRKASNLMQAVLQALPKDQLTRKNAVYLADMSKMPGFITRTFALPTLRDMPYLMGVSLDETTLAAWPRQTDAVTLIELDQKVVKGIRYVTTEADLRAALER
ncbi:hypothetical protein [Rhodoferax antarcticus]|uniref:FAD/FMN-containing dehydrogenase n=1 Tax=Rhodoferax antarcticus ANT.BR TaxID=1111071 RepID=A0A1Q8YBU3_9BURK|nr:hypothetical protein [Rhodoferax antarcticus]APW46595.1 hypothetical protein RA876_09695 [Rhodoferax antarcticus]OLP05463.1 hypothetical protein BLL52_3130 [Rhodoferax antarcticus ANT.BR]